MFDFINQIALHICCMSVQAAAGQLAVWTYMRDRCKDLVFVLSTAQSLFCWCM